MANNYSLWSFTVPCTAEERAFMKELYDDALDVESDNYDPHEPTCDGIEFDEDDPSEVVFYSEESGTLDHAADIVQKMLKKFKRKDAIYAEGAVTCSSPRPGEFGGYCVEITAKGQKWMNTGSVVSRWAQEYAKKQPRRKGKMK